MITFIPSRVDNELGRTKIDTVPVSNYNTQYPSSEFNCAMDYLAQLGPVVGLSDGSTPGSIIETNNDYGVRITNLENAASNPIRYQGIVVGISTAGDTASNCDYLDTGNGVQLQAAITAAGSTKDVWVRPGTIDLSAGPITIPASGVVRFSGATKIRPSGTDRRAIICSSNVTISNLFVDLPQPSPGATGANLIEIDFGTTLHNPIVTMQYTNTAPVVTNESLRYLIKDVTSSALVNIQSPKLICISFENHGLVPSLTGISLTANAGGNAGVVTDATINGADVGISANGNIILSNLMLQSIHRRGVIAGSAISGGPPIACSPKVYGGAIKMNPTTEETVGIEVITGPVVAGTFCTQIHNLDICNSGATVGTSSGVRLSGTGVGSIVQGCSIDRFAYGVEGTSTQTYANITGNTTRVSTAAFSVLGTGSNISNNIVIP